MTKPSVAPSLIRQALRCRYGEVLGFHRVAEGLASQAFGFRGDGEDLIVRVRHSAGGFAKDAYAQRAFGRPALPIPEILEIGDLDDRHSFCISRRAPGVRLRDLDEGALEGVSAAVADTIAAIASSNIAATRGYGRFDARGAAPFTTWRAFVKAAAGYDWASVAVPVDRDMVGRALAALDALSWDCSEERRLVHGDFGSDNVLSDGAAVTAVIDWDLAVLGDPLYEWANVYFWGEDGLRYVRERFDGRGERARLLCYQLRIGLEELHLAATGGNPVDLDWLSRRCAALAREAPP